MQKATKRREDLYSQRKLSAQCWRARRSQVLDCLAKSSLKRAEDKEKLQRELSAAKERRLTRLNVRGRVTCHSRGRSQISM